MLFNVKTWSLLGTIAWRINFKIKNIRYDNKNVLTDRVFVVLQVKMRNITQASNYSLYTFVEMTVPEGLHKPWGG